MQGELKESCENKTLGDLKEECKRLGIKPEDFEKNYESIEQSVDISGLGKITFRLNPESYLNLEEIVNLAWRDYKEMTDIYQENHPTEDHATMYEKFARKKTRITEGGKRITSFDSKNVYEILRANINDFEELIKGDMYKEEVDFLKKIVNEKQPIVYFGVSDSHSTAYYTEGAVYINVNPEIDSLRFLLYYPDTRKQRFMGALIHEFIHYYDDQNDDIKNLFDKQLEKIDVLKTYSFDIAVNKLCDKMESIATIMESIDPGQMRAYADRAKDGIEDLLKRIQMLATSSTHWKKEFGDFFYESIRDYSMAFMTDIITNIQSSVILNDKSEYNNDFLLSNLRAAAHNNKTFTTENSVEIANSLHELFAEYRKIVQKSKIDLPSSLRKGMSDVIYAYIAVSREQLKKLVMSQQGLSTLDQKLNVLEKKLSKQNKKILLSQQQEQKLQQNPTLQVHEILYDEPTISIYEKYAKPPKKWANEITQKLEKESEQQKIRQQRATVGKNKQISTKSRWDSSTKLNQKDKINAKVREEQLKEQSKQKEMANVKLKRADITGFFAKREGLHNQQKNNHKGPEGLSK